MTPREKVVFKQPCEHCQRMTTVDLTAIASGSGDHAELARLARIWSDTSVTNHKMPGDTAVIWSRRLDALLAENAALRAERDALDLALGVSKMMVNDQDQRATEAERKLAEADTAIRKAARQLSSSEHESSRIVDARDTLCTFLSKEAER